MTELNQINVESELVRLSQLAEKVTFEISERAREAAVADAEYKRVYAAAYLMTQGKTVGEREAQCSVETADEYMRRRIAEARLLAAQEAGRNYRAQLEALRSINANLRSHVTG